MSESIIQIETYKTYNDLIQLSGRVSFPEPDVEIEIPNHRILNLYNYEVSDSFILVPRNYDLAIVKINISWKKDFHLTSFSNLLADNENPTEVISFRLQIVCDKTRWCSEQKKIDLSAINKRSVFNFEIPLNEVKGIIKIEGYITRENEAKGINISIPDSPLAILSTCKELSIQLDEIKDIGGEYLPILPGNTGDLAFEIAGKDNPFELPRILYSHDLKDYLTRDDLDSVSSSIITGMFFFLEQYLKWFIFICKIDSSDKYYNSLVELFSRYCSVPKEEIIEIVEKEKYSQDQTIKYLELSEKLYRGVQLQNKFKRELKNIYKSNSK
jgi:hypothetical protein